jgi:hypothetical protein
LGRGQRNPSGRSGDPTESLSTAKHARTAAFVVMIVAACLYALERDRKDGDKDDEEAF